MKYKTIMDMCKLIALISLALFMTSCASVNSLSKKYPDFVVKKKHIKQMKETVPHYKMYCVTYTGKVRCERWYGSEGAYSSCARACKLYTRDQYADHWVKKKVGTKEVEYDACFVTLEDPVLKTIIDEEVTCNVYNELSIGHKLIPK